MGYSRFDNEAKALYATKTSARVMRASTLGISEETATFAYNYDIQRCVVFSQQS